MTCLAHHPNPGGRAISPLTPTLTFAKCSKNRLKNESLAKWGTWRRRPKLKVTCLNFGQTNRLKSESIRLRNESIFFWNAPIRLDYLGVTQKWVKPERESNLKNKISSGSKQKRQKKFSVSTWLASLTTQIRGSSHLATHSHSSPFKMSTKIDSKMSQP